MIELMYFVINENSLSENLTTFAQVLCSDKKTPAGAGVFKPSGSVAHRAGYCRCSGITGTAFGSLEAKFYSLPRLNRTVPTDVGGCVGIAARYIGIPAAGYP